MLLIEKVVKLLDDFHFEIFREHVKHLSIRSYYPLVLLDVIDRSSFDDQPIEKLCRDVYGEYDENTHKKFIQLAHYTFRLTSFLAKNYPDYLFHNISRVQHLINSGKSVQGIQLLETLIEVAAKVEDRNTENVAQQIMAQHQILTEKRAAAMKNFERVEWLENQLRDASEIQRYMHTHHALRGSNPISKENLEEHFSFFEKFADSESFYVRFLQKCATFFFLHLARDHKFYSEEIFNGIIALKEDYEKNEHIIFPYLADYIHVLNFLKLHHFIQIASKEMVSDQIPELISKGKELLFWKSYFNITEFSSIVILANFYANNYFFSYQENHLTNIPQDVNENFGLLKKRCEAILDDEHFREKFITRYINLSTVYALLLCCGNQEDIKKSTQILEGLLINYQQIPFYGVTDSIYSILILGYFCLNEYESVDKWFRRFKKNLKDKTVTPDNDYLIQSIFYISKWLDTRRNQYVKKLEGLSKQYPEEKLNNVKNNIRPIIQYYNIPVSI